MFQYPGVHSNENFMMKFNSFLGGRVETFLRRISRVSREHSATNIRKTGGGSVFYRAIKFDANGR